MCVCVCVYNTYMHTYCDNKYDFVFKIAVLNESTIQAL